MPIPTDTFWNIKRLNFIFAVSAVVMMGTFFWAVMQDYGKTWREPQRKGRVWEAALIDAASDQQDRRRRPKGDGATGADDKGEKQ